MVAQHPSAPERERVDPDKWRQWGSISAGLALVLFPIVFSPVALYCGHKLKRTDEPAGLKIQAVAVVAIVIWALAAIYLL